jgi:hypothetical protein
VALDLNAVMDAIGARLVGVTGLRVYDYAADAASPPAAIVALPETVEYDVVAGRGADRVVIPVTVLVGRVSDRAARDQLAQYVSGTGASSVKTAIEGGTGDLGAVAHTVRVTEARIDVVTIGQIDYLGASFDVEVFD